MAGVSVVAGVSLAGGVEAGSLQPATRAASTTIEANKLLIVGVSFTVKWVEQNERPSWGWFVKYHEATRKSLVADPHEKHKVARFLFADRTAILPADRQFRAESAGQRKNRPIAVQKT